MRKTSAAVSVAAAVCLIGAATAPAFAAAPSPLAAAQALTTTQINGRLFWSGIAGLELVGDKNVPTADRNVLVPALSADVATLKSLLSNVKASTTVVQVFVDYVDARNLQIFQFVIPRLDVVRSADDLKAAGVSLTAKEASLQNAINTAAAAHKNVQPADAALADYKTQLALASQLSTSAHTAISLVRGAKGVDGALVTDGVKNFDATLHILAAAGDAHTIATVTGVTV